MRYAAVFATLAALALAIALVAAAFIFSGAYNVAATSQHLQWVHSLLETTMRQSVRLRARHIEAPPAADEARVTRGAGCYQSLCVQCHAAPGVAQNDIGKSMQPVPGPLVDAMQRWRPRELYWITRHGIKLSGMPAWEFRLDDEQIWDIVAFIERLPALSPQAYADIVQTASVSPHGMVSATENKAAPATAAGCPRRELQLASTDRAPPDGGLIPTWTAPTAVDRGRVALSQYACTACHTIPGVTSSQPNVGPPLAGLAKRTLIAGRLANTPDNLVRWLRDPQAIKPMTAMPNLGVTEAHARDMAAYLATLD